MLRRHKERQRQRVPNRKCPKSHEVRVLSSVTNAIAIYCYPSPPENTVKQAQILLTTIWMQANSTRSSIFCFSRS